MRKKRDSALKSLARHLRFLKRKYVTGAKFARFGLDDKLKPYLDQSGGFYVELGANDGVLASNTYHLERKLGWRGVLIEPSPNLFLKCVRERGANNRVFCNACVGFDYTDRFVEIVYSDAMSVSLGVETDLTDMDAHLADGDKYLRDGEVRFTFGAVAATLQSLLDQANAPKTIDFLSLDVEGAEVEVLKGVDLSKYVFRYMLIECRNVEQLSSYLAPSGYERVDKLSHHDYLFRHRSVQAR